MPSPGNFDSNHRLLTTQSSGCNEWANRSVDDIVDEIVKIHQWNAANGITEFGFEPANEPNIEWYTFATDPALNEPLAWTDMDAYFTAIFDRVHQQYPSPVIRVLTPPMAQNAFAEAKRFGTSAGSYFCENMFLTDGVSRGYEKMANVFLTGVKNDGYDWHNYWGTGYEDWANCDPLASPHGHHVALFFPSQMLNNMGSKPKTITEADLASPIPPQFGLLQRKDAQDGVVAANSLTRFINAEVIADHIAVWALHITEPNAASEQNWHEAYCDDPLAPNDVRERQ